jgi:hypothetical protein
MTRKEKLAVFNAALTGTLANPGSTRDHHGAVRLSLELTDFAEALLENATTEFISNEHGPLTVRSIPLV